MRRSHLLRFIHLLLLGVALQWYIAGTSAFQPIYLCCDHQSPFGMLGSEIRHVLWRNQDWKEKVFPLIVFHYWK